MIEAPFRWLYRHPPRSGWVLFILSLTAVLMLPMLLEDSILGLIAGPATLGGVVGLLLGMSVGRRTWWLLLLPALYVPLILLDVAPPWSIVLGDIRSLLQRARPRPPLLFAAAVEAAAYKTWETLVAAWHGDLGALRWAIAHLAAFLGYGSAALLGFSLRRGAKPLAWSMPLMATLVVTGVTGRNTVGYIVTSVLLVLLVSLVGGFRSREMDWERRGFGFSDALRLDVILGGSLLLGVIMLLGLGTPPDPRNMLTTWLWHDVKLPAGLATLDTNEGLGSGVDRSRVAGLGPGQNLDLGHSLERGASQNVALTIQVKNMPSNLIPYWRGRIFEEYTGRGWTTGPIRRVTSGPFTLVEDTPDLIIQQITDSHTGSLPRYGLPDIVATKEGAVVEQTSLGDTVGWVGTAKTYTTYSHIPGPPSPNPPEEVERQRVLMPYRVVPDELPQRVIDLTNQLTNDGQTQTDKAQAIETYLRGLKYSYEVAPLPPDGDGVDQFLFSMRQGYCTYYASAMAIMARVAGIPSRVAVGYATGTYDAARGEYIVREQDAHAWPELYIAGQGWTRWEPTPIRPIPPRVTEPVPGLPPDVALEPTPQTATHLGWWPVLWAAVAILLIVAFRRLRLGAPASAASVHAELYRMGRSLGVMPTAGDTLEEYVGRIARVVPPARQPLVRVALLLTARLYRKTPLTPGEEHSLIYTWQTARDIVGEQRSSGAPLRNDRG